MGSCTSSMRDFMNGHDSSQPHVSLLVDAAKRDDYTQLHGILVLRERFPEYVNIDQADDDGLTALMWAIKNESLPAAYLLIRKGADITLVSKGGMTAEDYALTTNRSDIMDLIERSSKMPVFVEKQSIQFEDLRAKRLANIAGRIGGSNNHVPKKKNSDESATLRTVVSKEEEEFDIGFTLHKTTKSDFFQF